MSRELICSLANQTRRRIEPVLFQPYHWAEAVPLKILQMRLLTLPVMKQNLSLELTWRLTGVDVFEFSPAAFHSLKSADILGTVYRVESNHQWQIHNGNKLINHMTVAVIVCVYGHCIVAQESHLGN